MLIKLIRSLFARPPAPPGPPDVIERDDRGVFYKVRKHKVRFDPRDAKHHAVVRMIARTGAFPPKGAGVARGLPTFGLYDKATDTVYPCDEAPDAYLLALHRIHADRAELLRIQPSDPQNIDWSTYVDQS